MDLWNFWKETWHEPGVYEERPDGPRVAESQKAESYLVENLVQYGVTPSHIGVVAFYTAQVGNLRWYQFNKNIPQAGYDEVEVCTTSTWQGGEVGVLILHLVNTNRVGFLNKPNCINNPRQTKYVRNATSAGKRWRINNLLRKPQSES